MSNSNRNRFRRFISIVFNAKFFAVLSFVYGVLKEFRDEVLPVEMANKLRLSGVFETIDWYWFVITGLFVWAVSIAWESTKRIQEHQEEKTDSTLATASNGGNALAVKFNLGNITQGNPQPKQHEVFDILPNTSINNGWISTTVLNPINKTIECYCIWSSVQLDGELREDIKAYITAHSHRVSWSEGDTKGKEEGVKCIDPNNNVGVLNIATPTHAGLRFETAGGPRDLGYDMNYGKGTYRIKLDLRYRPIGEGEFQSKGFEVCFVCGTEPFKIQIQAHLDQDEKRNHNIIKVQFGAQTLTDFLTVRESMYLELIQ